MEAIKALHRHKRPRLQGICTAIGLILTASLLAAPHAAAQNVNDLLRIIIPPLIQQPSAPPVYIPPPAPRRTPQPSQQPHFPRPAPVNPTPSISRAEVQQAQQMLNDLGYDAGAPDGIAGRRTLEALNTFQRHNGLSESRSVDKRSMATLSAVHRNVLGSSVASSAEYSQTAQPAHVPVQAPHSAAPAFDCARAASPTEVALCNDVALGALDAQLSALYIQELARLGPQATVLQNEQRQWLNQRNQCGADRSCLLNVYAERMAALSSTPETPSGAYPAASPVFSPEVLPRAAASVSRSDLRKLATPPSSLQPIEFNYFQEVPLMAGSASANLFDLMRFAHEAPRLARREPSPLSLQECNLIYRFFTAEARQPYIVDKQWGRPTCFRGNNEFEYQDFHRSFYADHLEALQSFAPTAPFRLAVAQQTAFRQYDPKTGQFPLEHSLASGFNSVVARRMGGLQFSLPSQWPKPVLSLDETAARQLIEKVGSWTYKGQTDSFTGTRYINVVAVIDVLGVDYDAQRVDMRLVSVGLYGPGLKEHVYEFTLPVDFGALVRGDFPERFNIPSPVPLDTTFALVQRVSHPVDNDIANQQNWADLFHHLQRRDKEFYGNPPTEALPNDDLRLPVFPSGATWHDSRHRQQLERWVAAYLAGLPGEIELAVDLTPSNQHTRAESDVVGLRAFGYHVPPRDTFDSFIDSNGLRKDQIAYWSGGVNLLLAAPDQLNLYMLVVPRSAFAAASTPLRQKTVFRLGAITPIHHSHGKLDFLVDLEPLRMTFENEQEVIAERDFADVRKLAGSFVQAPQATEAAELSASRSGGPLPFGPALLDVMVVKALGDQLSEPALAAATARRWHFEQADTSPVGGTFYIRGRRAPEPQDLSQLAPQFKTWSGSALPDGPWELKVALNSTSDWQGLQCNGSAKGLNDSRTRPRSSNAAIAAREKARTHDHHNRNALVRAQRTETLNREFARPGVGSWTKSQTMELQTLTLAVHMLDRYQEIGERCGLSGYVPGNPDLASIYLHIEDGVPPPPRIENHNAPTAEAILEITGVRLASREPHYSDLLPPDFVSRRKLASPDRDRQAIILDARLKEIVYFSSGGEKEIERKPRDPELSIQSLVAASQTEPPTYQAPEGAYGWDIVGIQLGMTMDEAEAIIRKHMDVGRVLEGKRLHDGSAQSGMLVPVSSGKLFISTDQLELIALIDEPPAAAGKVLAAWRHLYIPSNTMPLREAIEGLREKYGDPPNTPVKPFTRWYTPSGSACDFLGSALPLSANWTEHGKPVELKQGDGKPMSDARLPKPYRDPLDPRYENTLGCGPLMTALLQFHSLDSSQPSRPKSMDLIEQTLTDIGPYMQAFQANREAAQAKSNDQKGDEGHRPSRPKF